MTNRSRPVALNYCMKFVQWCETARPIIARGHPALLRLYELVSVFAQKAHIFQLPAFGRTLQGVIVQPAHWAEYMRLPYPITAFEYPCIGGPGGDSQEIVSKCRISLCVDQILNCELAKELGKAVPPFTNLSNCGFVQYTIYSIDSYTAAHAKRTGRTVNGMNQLWQVACGANYVGSNTIREWDDMLGENMRRHVRTLVARGEMQPSEIEHTEEGIRHARRGRAFLGAHTAVFPGVENLDKDALLHETADELHAAVQACVTLNCKNITAERIEAPAALNNKRSAAGKLPLRSFHILTLKGRPIDEHESLGGNHASPRRHFRRGHIRHLEGKMTWVRDTIVNRERSEQVEKAYSLKPAES